MANILVINGGSSSVKFQVLNEETEEVVLSGLAEGLGLPSARIEFKFDGEKTEKSLADEPTHTGALTALFEFLDANDLTETISAVGHRVVHGGETFSESALITDEVLDGIKAAIPYAPLHNPAHILGIDAITEINPELPQVAVFDTAFHTTMPAHAYRYAVPKDWYTKHGVRRYGAHGTSYRFIVEKTAKILGKKPADTNLIIAHLGSGASISAIKNGESVDTTMGFTPLEGVSMGTRSGDLDASVIPFIMEREGLTADEVITKLNKESGHKGVSGVSDDLRDIEGAAADGNEDAKLALDIFAHKCAKYIGGLMTSLDSIDALVFTAGVGENGAETREAIVKKLEVFGFKIDEKINDDTRGFKGKEGLISAKSSKYPIYALATNEELMIAKDTAKLAKKK